MTRKETLAVVLISVIHLIILLAVPQAKGADPAAWYAEASGGLKTDYYLLYPFKARDLKIGFSKYGEKIKAQPAPAVGLQYGGPVTADPATSGADPFANPGVPMQQWVEGWWLAITYQHRSLGWRSLWAWALFSDFSDWGSPADADYTSGRVQGGWIRFPRTTGPSTAASTDPRGGRKTNAKVVTEELKELYKGPRKYVALISHTLYDSSVKKEAGSWVADEGPGVALVQINILIEFDRVNKEVIQTKDVKLLIDDKTMIGDAAYLELRNSGQWDLGTSAHYRSYAHFYTLGEAPTTKYGKEYHKDSADGTHGMQWPMLGEQWGKYAKAQIISSMTKYVGWAAFWPHPSYWTVDGFSAPFTKWGKDLTGQWPWLALQYRVNDMAYEPEVPFVGAEWDFIFSLSRNIVQFRGIATYGVTDLNDGDDANIGTGHVNTIDREVKFQNDEIFNPYDLKDAAHIETSRKVQFFSGDGFTKKFDLKETPIDPASATWDKYCSFAEKVLVGGALSKRVSTFPAAGQYTLTWRTIEFGTAPPFGTNNIKVLYSTLPTQEKVDLITYASGQADYSLSHRSKTMTIELVGKRSTSLAVLTSDYAPKSTGGDGIYDSISFVASPRYNDGSLVANGDNLKVVYSIGVGSWQWITVGKEAATIDSSGAAMVSEAFESLKNMEVAMSGLDISDIYHGPIAAYLFYRFTIGAGTRADYRDTSGRSRFLDDFCGTYAIDSSSMIHIGGPLANLGAEYINEFLPIFYGITGSFWYTDPAYQGRIVAASCWSMKTYSGLGYAVVGLYKDINGAVHLVIWGATGQDTYYATLWFWRGMKGFVDINGNGIQDLGETAISGPGLRYLETEKKGVTSIVLYFDYSKHITATNFVVIKERIATISEVASHS